MKSSSIAEISSKGQIPKLSLFKILGTIRKMGKVGTRINEPEDKTVDDDVQGVTIEK